MRRRSWGMALATSAWVVVATLAMGTGAAAASPSAGSGSPAATRTRWGAAELVPGLSALNIGHNAAVTAASCWAPGGCQVAGYYTDRHRHAQAFLARETRGRWGRAAEVPGTAAMNQGGSARVSSVHCARTSVCVAVGTYTDKAGHIQWFTANETNGQWTTAVAVPYPALNQAVIETVWCSTGGLCASGGWYTDPATSATQAWVRTEARGHWQPGLEVPGIAALNVTNSPFGDYVALDAVSCTSPGNCAAGGQYTSTTSITDNGFPALQAFVVSETNGTWGTAQEVPGTATLNSAGGDANTTFITCASAGNCTAAGYFQGVDVTACDPPATPNDGPGPPPFPGCGTVFVVSEQHGVWRQAGATALADVLSLACPGAGNCVASGDIDVFTVSENQAGALVSESGGHLGNTVTITNTTSLNSVSCTSPGYCSAGGSSATNRAAVITEWGGRWGKAVGVSGLLPRSPGSIVNAVACPPRVVLCVAGGSEFTAKGGVQAFIVSQVTYRAG